MTEPTHCAFIIRQRGKPIPYHGFERADGTNHGFKKLKGQPEAVIRAIPEAADFSELQDALVRLNDANTGVFTVGCEKSFNREGDKHWARGYIELSLNYRDLIGDAQHYFKLFFEFSRHLHVIKFELPVQYVWELESAEFTELSAAGFTVAVWVTTNLLPDEATTRRLFGDALTALTDFLCSGQPVPLATLF